MPKTIQPLLATTDKTLMSQTIEPLGFTIGSILPHGLFILGGSSKIGKSWLALDLCHTVANGGQLWDYPATQGEALYLALEDTPKRIQERLAKIAPAYDLNAPGSIHFVYRAQKLGEGLAEQLAEFLKDNPKTQLIVIDTLQYIRNNGKFNGTYSDDYRDMDALREIIRGRKLTMLLITHNCKSDASDPINKVHGSAGLTGAVDGIFVLEKNKRIGDMARLTISNRDTESYQFDIRFDSNCRWEYIGETGKEENNHEHLCELINHMLDESPGWNGTATQLCAALTVLDPAFSTAPFALSKTLKAQQELLTQHSIICDFARNKTTRSIQLKRKSDQNATV